MLKYYGLRVPTRFLSETINVKDPNIYYDVYLAPDPIPFKINISVQNNLNQDIYVQASPVTLPSGWNMATQNLGSVPAFGKSNFTVGLSRVKPTDILKIVENLEIAFKIYLDSNYTDLYDEITDTFTAIGINSEHPDFVVIDKGDFDDGTLQGWSVVREEKGHWGYPSGSNFIDDTYYVSPPYGYAVGVYLDDGEGWYGYVGLSKTIDTSIYTEAYLVAFSTYKRGDGSALEWRVIVGDKEYIVPVENTGVGQPWTRICVPVPIGTDVLVKVTRYLSAPGVGTNVVTFDDIKIVGL